MRIVLAGASELLCSHLVPHLAQHRHADTRLVRRPPSAPDEAQWDPYAGDVDQDLICRADVVIILAGSPLIGTPHSKKWASELVKSRVTPPRLPADRVATIGRASCRARVCQYV